MLKSGILNPGLNRLLSLTRHTNTLVIADRGFPYWPQLETVDLSLVDDIPRVLEVLAAIRNCCVIGSVRMAREFQTANSAETIARFREALDGIPLKLEPHTDFKLRVPGATGLIRTGDTIPYANMILESA